MDPQATVPHGDSGTPVRSLFVEVIEGPDKGATQTSVERMSIGTGSTNDFVLSDPTVSHFHLDLVRGVARIRIEDHDSTNGTRVGEVWVRNAEIAPGSQLKLGKSVLLVSDGEPVRVDLFDGAQLGGILGSSPPMRRLMATIQRAARSNSSVLVLGETGAGKEVVARAIHDASPRSAGPFETVDCGSMLPTLIASELFGHEKGAFTGAESKHLGAFERADGGTLFLDEIGELPPNLQTSLLGALERRSFRRVGGKAPISVDVRVVCATNRDLSSEVNRSRFREDLYYRVAVIVLRVPPLRERVDDIPLLAEHFLREAGYDGVLDDVLPQSALSGLAAHDWPGNVRELRNVVESAMVMGEAPTLGFATESSTEESQTEAVCQTTDIGLPFSEAKTRVIQVFEAQYLAALLEETRGNVSLAAKKAKIDRSHLTRLLKKHAIKPERG